MQCRYCKSQDLELLSSDYYICHNCGKLNDEYKSGGKKSGSGNELYFAIGIIAAGMILTLFILLFVTASIKKEKLRTAAEKTTVSTENVSDKSSGKK